MVSRLDRWADPPLLVLASLADEPKHGYAITRDVAETMGVRLSPGTLYAVIAGGIPGPDRAAGASDRRRPYQITRAGAAVLAQESARMSAVASLARSRLSRVDLASPGCDRRDHRARAAVRAVLALYPPAWRERYGDEVCALVEDSGTGPAILLGLAWRAAPVWISPPRQLHDRDARMRASLAGHGPGRLVGPDRRRPGVRPAHSAAGLRDADSSGRRLVLHDLRRRAGRSRRPSRPAAACRSGCRCCGRPGASISTARSAACCWRSPPRPPSCWRPRWPSGSCTILRAPGRGGSRASPALASLPSASRWPDRSRRCGPSGRAVRLSGARSAPQASRP